MVFTSNIFVFYFLPLTLIIYFISPRCLKNLILLIFSLFFYFAGEGKGIVIMLFSIVINYFFALLVSLNYDFKNGEKVRKFILFIGVILNLLPLFYFKYFNFFINNLNKLFSLNINLKNIVMPIGISFFTFQGMSYLIDIYRKESKAEKNILNVGLYISLFPQLVAGPIVRYENVKSEIKYRKENIFNITYGLKRFMLGFSKKVLIANPMGQVANYYFDFLSSKTTFVGVVIAVISYTLQLYYDFSGYSDMAIGLGNIFGFNFPENFNFPFISKSITEFWRRWHISLSTWFKDYVYIPLGGNKKGLKRQIFNILIVWSLTGFWHGANYNFIIWGFYYGVLLIIEKFIINKKNKFKLPICLSYTITIFLILVGFGVFRLENKNDYINILNSISFKNGFFKKENLYFIYQYYLEFALAIVLCFPFEKYFTNMYKSKLKNIVTYLILLFFFIISLMSMTVSDFNPFIYFRF